MFDVVIVGGGPGGYRAAKLLGNDGYSVALIEKDLLGGVCLNQGCIPFKTYLHTASVIQSINTCFSEKIFNNLDVGFNQESLLRKKEKVIKALRQGLANGLSNKGVVLVQGEAHFICRQSGTYVFDVDGDRIEGKKIIIATGSTEKELPEIDVSGNTVKLITSKNMLEMQEVPESIVIIGAGAIGLEAACYFNNVGSKVSVVEASHHIGTDMDCDIAENFVKILGKKGISIKTGARYIGVSGDIVEIENSNGNIERIQSDYLMFAIGRKPNIDIYMLDALGIEYDKNGISVDDRCRTSDYNVFACGDVTGKIMLAHTATYQAKVIEDTINGIDSRVEYSIIPKVIYTNPEVLSVGVNEQECKHSGVSYQSEILPMTYSGKYFSDYGKDGAKAKIIINDQRQVIGFHMIGNTASELSLFAEVMIKEKMTIDSVSRLVYAHPTYSEIIGELASELV